MKETTLKIILRNFGIVGIILCSINALGQVPSSSENYIKTTTYKVPTPSSITNPSAQRAVVEVTYFDGLGRPKQKVAHQQAGDGGDLVTHIEYDGFGRQPKEFLPYVRSASLEFDANGLHNVTSFYSNPSNGPTTSNPWGEKLFEESPLNRVLKQAAPGNDWAMNSGHEVEFAYETNTTNEVHYYKVNLAPNNPTLQYKGKYPEGHLRKNVIKDENWQAGDDVRGTVEQFTDKMGRMVLKRTYGVSNIENITIQLDTYYVYDVYGNLTYVLPPKLSEQIPSSGTLSPEKLDALAYQYKYDHRNRMIHKKLPGKKREFMVYDALDRLIATGPVLSPFGDGAEGWLRTKYDEFNRVVYTFWQQGLATEQTQLNLIPSNPTYVSEKRLSGTSKSTVNGVDFSYTNRVTPTSGYHILTVNYYDDYSYNGAPATIPTTVADGQSTVYYNNTSLKPKGLSTGSWVRELETVAQHNAITSFTLYDKKARPVRVKSINAANGYTQTDTKFDFIGNPLTTITKHKINSGAVELTVTDGFSYTPQSRLLKQTHKIGNGNRQLMTLNQYNNLGQLESKKVGGPDTFSSNYLQKVDYKYNIRGWLTDINNVISLSKPGEPQDLFAFKINYNTVTNDVSGAVKPLYNGNIAETYWRTSNDNIKRKYGYSYDYQNRLLAAYYQIPGTAIPLADSYSTSYSYDTNGNILTLKRNGEIDDANNVMGIDDLAYSYDVGNKLKNVRDYELASEGYDDQNTSSSQEFFYDEYGNLIENKDKQITNIKYNHLNLPTEITFYNGGKIEYFYDATGIKLKKKATFRSTITTTEYMDGFQYKNTALDFFPTAEGYVKVLAFGGGTSYNYVFNYTDHLGNIRAKYTQDPNDGMVTLIEENQYYPYGLIHNGYNPDHSVFEVGVGGNVIITPVTPLLGDSYTYKFGGKEYQDEFDINTYDFGARNYDPALGRWMNVDPLAESYFALSPYVYVANNPVLLRDPDGKRIDFSFTYDDEGRISNVNIHVTGKVIDNTKRGLSSEKMNSARDKIVDGINNIEVTGKGVDINFTSNIEIANKEEDIASDDHVYRIVDDVSKVEGINHSDPDTRPIGAARVGENIVYLDKNYFTSRTAAHETGHSAGLFHIDKTNERHLFPAAYAFAQYMGNAQGDGGTRAYFRNSAMKMSLSRPYTGDDFYGNLMHQGSTRNSKGQPVSGYLITRDQVNAVLYKYRNGQINKGKQE